MAEDESAAAPARVLGAADIAGVLRLLPHRYPMLLVDRIEALVAGSSARGIKAVSYNEAFFQGHFPSRPVMPGVLIIEALAQTAGVLALSSLGDTAAGKLVYFMAIEQAKFRAPVEPGVLLALDVSVIQKRAAVWKFAGRASIDGKLAAEALFTAMVADAP